jgi:biopolymer transport protein ExbD
VNFRHRPRESTFHLDLTPMIDVIFQLVLFLLLATTFRKPHEHDNPKSPGIQIDLPRSSAQAVISEKKDLSVWMSEDGGIFLDDKPVQADELKRAFALAAEKDSSTLVIIKADKGVTHGRVVTVMDLARNQGLSRLAIATAAGDSKL